MYMCAGRTIDHHWRISWVRWSPMAWWTSSQQRIYHRHWCCSWFRGRMAGVGIGTETKYLLLLLLHILEADRQLDKSQLKYGNHVLGLLRKSQHVASHLHTVILHLHESLLPNWDIKWCKMENDLRYLIRLHRMPFDFKNSPASLFASQGEGNFSRPGWGNWHYNRRWRGFSVQTSRDNFSKAYWHTTLNTMWCFLIKSL